MFGQVFGLGDLPVIGLLILLEGVMSIDNALVLGLLAKRVRPECQKQVLTYGLIGAFVFRVVAISVASFLLTWHIVKLLGGGYLLWVAGKYFWQTHLEHRRAPRPPEPAERPAAEGPGADDPAAPGVRKYARFWPTVLVVEFTDIAFAVDSIVAAIGVVGPPPEIDGVPVNPHPKLWVVIVGGMIGLILMRFAAILFIRLLTRFPRFETAAYLLVCVIGLKLALDYLGNNLFQIGGGHAIDFHSPNSPWFWGFWVAMSLSFLFGFLGAEKNAQRLEHARHHPY